MLYFQRFGFPKALAARTGCTILAVAIVTLCADEAFAQSPAPDSTAQQGQQGQAPPQQGQQGQSESSQTGAEAAPAEGGAVDNRPFPPPPPAGGSAQGGYGQQGYYGQPSGGSYMPPPPEGVYRPFSFTFGLGPAFLRLDDEVGSITEGGFSYGLRFGFGIQPDVLLTLGFEGAAATSDDGLTADQDAILLGVQYFATQVVYVRGAMGIANQTEEENNTITRDQHGLGLQGALGVDLLQSSNIALSLEANVLWGRYSEETWTSGGLNLLFSLY